MYQHDAVARAVEQASFPIFFDPSIEANVIYIIKSAELVDRDLFFEMLVHEERADMMRRTMSEGGSVGVGLACVATVENNNVRPIAIQGVIFTENPTFKDAQVVKIYE